MDRRSLPTFRAAVFSNMNALILLAMFALLPLDGVLRERCDRIELNHFYDSDGRLIFDQLLFYDWCPVACRFQLRAWRMQKSSQQNPRFDHARGCWCVEWFDGDLHRRITAAIHRETFTLFDPELTEREFLPKEQRRELIASPITKRK